MSNLALTISELRNRVGHFLGYGRAFASFNSAQQGIVNECIDSGYRKFLFPDKMPDQMSVHEWSFLRAIIDFNIWKDHVNYINTSVYAIPNTTLTFLLPMKSNCSILNNQIALQGYESSHSIVSYNGSSFVFTGASQIPANYSLDITIPVAPVQSGADYLVTRTAGDVFTAAMVGMALKWPTGLFQIIEFIDANNVKVSSEDILGSSLLPSDMGTAAVVKSRISISSLGNFLLPIDFGGIESRITFSDMEDTETYVEISNEYSVRNLRVLNDNKEDMPKICCLMPIKLSAIEMHRTEMRFAPVPDKDYDIKFCQKILINRLDDNNPHHVGGMKFSELLLEACLAQAEESINDEIGVHASQFIRMLMAAIASDNKQSNVTSLGLNLDKGSMDLPKVNRTKGYVTYENEVIG